jgi:hypothetical protein
MSRIQKVWLGIFTAMFVVPEMLWSPVINLVYSFLQNSNNVKVFRPNFTTNSDNTNLLIFFLAFQLTGLIGALVLISKAKFNLWVKSILILILLLMSILTGLVFYVAFSLRHGIGF